MRSRVSPLVALLAAILLILILPPTLFLIDTSLHTTRPDGSLGQFTLQYYRGLFTSPYFVTSLRKRSEAVEKNPWRATTLEWSLPSPPPLGNFAGSAPVVYRGAYEFAVANCAEDFASQSLPTDATHPAPPGRTDPGLQPLPPSAAGERTM